MTIYIADDIIMNKAIIEFLRDDHGNQQALQFLLEIQEKAKVDKKYEQFFARIQRGLEFLEHYGVTKDQVVLEIDGIPYTLRLVKELKAHIPLCEFRVNWLQIGAFRALFFVYYDQGKEILLFTHAMIKQQTSDSEFEKLILKSKAIMEDFLKQPDKFL
ncbi:hypothetical protein T458_05445 [Brevibacillus panacihumi W25]|uniref:Type II toxin-antitoxin system RelE/ParE family toxin n=2 Tax=Brevibacillus panacihumi TaxID=497735 RepID=V6MCY9_9BACL|nr:hypothetical protein T458_05445 [Brevibacillus panacihumi W25]